MKPQTLPAIATLIAMEFKINNYLLTTSDFAELGWHDCTIYKIKLDSDLEMDIDYILKWNDPDIEGMQFTFWISPATLVFHSISDLRLDLEESYSTSFEIDYIEMKDSGIIKEWSIVTQNGFIEFNSPGFEQYIRQEPFYEFSQNIDLFDRGGYSLERTSSQENKNRYSQESIERRAKDGENYDLVKKRRLARLEIDKLLELRDSDVIDVKTYLRRKRELTDVVYSYDQYLKDTRFAKW